MTDQSQSRSGRSSALERLGLVKADIPAEVAAIVDKRLSSVVHHISGQVSAHVPAAQQIKTVARDAYMQGWMDALVNTGHFDT